MAGPAASPAASIAPQPLRGRWFDGQSSRPQQVLVSLLPASTVPDLQLHRLAQPGAPALTFSGRQVGWPERWSAGHAPPPRIVVDLREHGSLEIADTAAWQAALAAAGMRGSLAQHMLTRWRVLAAVLLVALAGLWAFYRWGTPWAATQITRQVPLDWETSLTDRALHDLDARWLKPSQLPAARQAQLRERFAWLATQVSPDLKRYGSYAPVLTLSFRSGLGANAFALPGGTVVMTDALVLAAQKDGLSDDALLGVLAHEIGHVMHRHTTRLVVEQGVLNIGMGLALGDVSNLLSMGGSLLTGLAYRRSHETEADCFALALMARARLPTGPMADLLLGMEGAREGRKAGEAGTDKSGVLELLSSHPDTALRARRLKDGQAQGC